MHFNTLHILLPYLALTWAAPLYINIPGVLRVSSPAKLLGGGGAAAPSVSVTTSIPSVPTVPTGTPTPVGGVGVVQTLGLTAPLLSVAENLRVSIDLGGLGLGGLGGLGGGGIGAPTGTVSSVGAPITTGTPSVAFDQLAQFIDDLEPISTVDTLKSLDVIVRSLQAALNNFFNDAKDSVKIEQIIAYTVTVLRNLNAYLVALPDNLAADKTILAAAAQVDKLLASYLIALQVAGGGTVDFAAALYKAGLAAPSSYSPLLGQTIAILPPFPQ